MSIADPVWRTMMDRCIAYEFKSFDALASKAQPTSED
jgi:isochorismate pyruvate lyase